MTVLHIFGQPVALKQPDADQKQCHSYTQSTLKYIYKVNLLHVPALLTMLKRVNI